MSRINNPIALMGATDEEVKQQLDETDNARNRMVAGITYSIAIVKDSIVAQTQKGCPVTEIRYRDSLFHQTSFRASRARRLLIDCRILLLTGWPPSAASATAAIRRLRWKPIF